MSETYTPSTGRGNDFAAASLGGFCVLVVFSLLPLLHVFPGMFTVDPPYEIAQNPDRPPDAFEKPVEPIPVEPETIEKPVIEEKPPEMTITMMENLINPGDNGSTIDVGWGPSASSIDTKLDAFLVSEVDKKPYALVQVKPVYPYSLRGESGQVTLEFVIDSRGSVRNAKVKKSTNWQFESPAIDSVHRTKWEPGYIENKAVDTIVSLTIQFRP